MQTGLNSFTLTPKQWIEKTSSIGITSQAGRYGGTYAYKDIAFEFASWVSVEFKLYLIKEFQRLKEGENRRLSLAWNLNRTLSKLNYRIHTDAIKAHLIPPEVTPAQSAITYATEADVLNVVLFGQTAKQSDGLLRRAARAHPRHSLLRAALLPEGFGYLCDQRRLHTQHRDVSEVLCHSAKQKMHWATHGHTAAEVIHERADSTQPLMGLKSARPGKIIRREDVSVAKNYLSEEEL